MSTSTLVHQHPNTNTRTQVQHDCGNISSWNVSNLTNLDFVFCGDESDWKCNPARQSLDADLSLWNTNKITSLRSTFRNADAMNLNSLTDWNTSSLVSLQNTFRDVDTSLDHAIATWNTQTITTLEGTFRGTSNFTGLGMKNWDTSSVTDLSYTFHDASALERDIGNLDVWSVTESSNVFSSQGNNLDNCTKRSIYDSWNSKVDVPESWGSVSTCPRSLLESLDYYYSHCLDSTSCTWCSVRTWCSIISLKYHCNHSRV